MARIARASATLTDISDGSNPISARLTNENHTFAASSAGAVSNLGSFETELEVFVGGVQSTYSASTATPNTHRITNLAYTDSPSGWGVPTANAAGLVTIPSIDDSASLSAAAVITFSVTNENGNVVSGLTVSLSLSVVREGTGGAIVSLVSNRGNFRASNEGTLVDGQGDIIFSIDTQGTVGDLVVQTSLDGATFATQSTTGAVAGDITAFDTDTAGDVETTGTIPTAFARLRITQENLGNANNTLAVRVAGTNGGQDTISIIKVLNGERGESAIIVSIQSDGGFDFKNSAGAAKTLTCVVRDADDGSQLTTGVAYHWIRSGSGSTSAGTVRVASSTNPVVVATGGVEANGTAFPMIIVGPEDVSQTEGFDCEVTVP